MSHNQPARGFMIPHRRLAQPETETLRDHFRTRWRLAVPALSLWL